MGKRIAKPAWVLLSGACIAFGCSGSSKQRSGDEPSSKSSRSCDPGTRRCEGLNVKRCSDDGTEEEIEETCLPNQTCANGACADNACVPNTKFCKDGAVWKCDAKGSGSSLANACPSGRFCRDDDGAAYCSDQACTPGQATCDGNVASTCAADGSGPKPGGTDCAKTKQACYRGECQDVACMSGTKVCQHDDVYICSQNGTDVTLLQECSDSEACDASLGACRPKVCESGKLGCDAARVVKCNAYGTGWDQTEDCTASSEICVLGECQKQVCSANSMYCNDGDVYQCDANGVTARLYESCDPDFSRCVSNGGNTYAYCAGYACQPGVVFCENNSIKTCNADGTVPQAGTDCGAEKYCDAGSCKPKVCEPFTYYCKSGSIYYCEYFGGSPAGEQPLQVCPSDTICQIVGGSAACAPRPCSPGEASCLNNKVGTCAADGQSLSSVTDDCGADGKVCGLNAECVESVVDTVGVAEDAVTEGAGTIIGDAIQVTSARKLTEMQINVVLAAARELRWVVYEQTGQSFVARVDKVASNQSGTGFISSGPMSYGLKAGKTYLLGVAISGGNFISYYDAAPFNPSISFGTLIGRTEQVYSATLGAYVESSALYQMKLTTELP